MSSDAAFWDRTADKYASTPVPDPDRWARKLAVAREHLPADGVLLELGCGTGTAVVALAPHAAHVHAIDISSEMLARARRRAEEAGVDNVTFHHQPIDELSAFEPGSLAGVCAFSVLHLTDDPAAVTRRLFELLAPGGFFLQSTVCLGGGWVPYGVVLPVMRWFGQAPHVRILDEGQVRKFLTDAGFERITSPEVGAGKQTAFLLAHKPA